MTRDAGKQEGAHTHAASARRTHARTAAARRLFVVVVCISVRMVGLGGGILSCTGMREKGGSARRGRHFFWCALVLRSRDDKGRRSHPRMRTEGTMILCTQP